MFQNSTRSELKDFLNYNAIKDVQIVFKNEVEKDIVRVSFSFKSLDGTVQKNVFRYKTGSVLKDQYFTISKNMLVEKVIVIEKMTIFTTIMIAFSILCLIVLLTFLCCKKTFFVFMSKDKEENEESIDSGECSVDEEIGTKSKKKNLQKIFMKTT